MNQGVPIRDRQNLQKQPKLNPFASGCLGILGLLVISSIVGQCSQYNIDKKEASLQKQNIPKPSVNKEENLEEEARILNEEIRLKLAEEKEESKKADRSNYAQAVKYHKAHDFDNALKYLYNISKSYSGYSEVKKLIAINQSNKRKIDYAVKMVAREIYANRLEQAFLDQGADTDVTVYGSKYDRIKIKYILSSRVFANEFGKSTLCSQIGEMGFKHIEIYGGLDNMRWTFNF